MSSAVHWDCVGPFIPSEHSERGRLQDLLVMRSGSIACGRAMAPSRAQPFPVSWRQHALGPGQSCPDPSATFMLT